MTRRWVRAALLVMLLGVTAAAVYQIFVTEQAVQQQQKAERAFTGLAWQLAVSLSDLRGAQEAYVAAGQDSEYWTEQVAVLLATITSNLASLRALSTSEEAGRALDEASGVIDALRQMDGLVRDHSAAGQQLLASDLIFTDGLELVAKASARVDEARAAEQTARDRATAERRQDQILALGAAMATSLLVALLLLPIGRRAADVAGEAEPSATADAPTPEAREDRLMLADLDLALDPDRLAVEDAVTDVSRAEAAAPPQSREPIPPAPDLRLAAEVCTELGRLSSTSELPALLARASTLLNASGIIVWVRAPAGDTLQAAIGHGYPSATLSRLGAIHRDDDNAVAAAFRAGQLQVVTGDGQANGAIVAPLLSSTSCVGVMSAELLNGWETSDAVRATASILAAQLTTLVAPPSEARAERAQA